MPSYAPEKIPTPSVARRSRQRVWWLVGTVTAPLLTAEAITIVLLLGVMEAQVRDRLQAAARRMGDLVEAVARGVDQFDFSVLQADAILRTCVHCGFCNATCRDKTLRVVKGMGHAIMLQPERYEAMVGIGKWLDDRTAPR